MKAKSEEAGPTQQSRAAVKRQEREDAAEKLRKILKPGDTVQCVLRHVSRSGMQRVIDLYALDTDNDGRCVLRWIGGLVARACDMRYDQARNGIVAGGCGMDMGFYLVYELGATLWGDGYGCIGEQCRSNDHSNGDRDRTPHGELIDDQTFSGRAQHWHRDGGYALKHEWI